MLVDWCSARGIVGDSVLYHSLGAARAIVLICLKLDFLHLDCFLELWLKPCDVSPRSKNLCNVLNAGIRSDHATWSVAALITHGSVRSAASFFNLETKRLAFGD